MRGTPHNTDYPPNKTALTTSDHGIIALAARQMAVITSGCVPVQGARAGRADRAGEGRECSPPEHGGALVGCPWLYTTMPCASIPCHAVVYWRTGILPPSAAPGCASCDYYYCYCYYYYYYCYCYYYYLLHACPLL